MEFLRQKTHEILRWSEKYTQADMVYVAKGGFWVTFGQTIATILSLGLVIAFANLLPKESYGLYKYILSLASVLNIFSFTGMNNAVSRAVAAGDEGALRASVRYQLKWGLLMLLAFLAVGAYYFLNDNTLLGTSFLILGVFVPPTLALNTYGAYLDGKKQFRLASTSTVISTLIYIAGMLVALLWSKNVVWLITAYALTTFLSTLLFYIVILRKFKLPLATSGETLRYGRELTFLGFIGPIASQIDKIVLVHFYGVATLAIYSLAMAIPDRATAFIKNWVGIGLPKFVEKTVEEINSIFYKRVFQGMVIGGLATLSYVLVAPYLFRYLLPQYIDSVFYSQILAVSLLFAIPNRYVSLLLLAHKLSRAIFVNNMIQNILKTLVYVVLGIWGGVLGLVIANVLNSLISMIINIAVWQMNTAKG